MTSSVLVTGGAGFIGSHLVDQLLQRDDVRVTVLDKLTYAGNLANLDPHLANERFAFVHGDVTDLDVVHRLAREADHVVHSAAESFVDRSIADPSEFIRSNVLGTHAVLDACRDAGKPLLYLSTDEVYGSLEEGGSAFGEESPLRPNSPYAASKAAGDLLCRAYRVTYGTTVAVARGTNAYGPRQHPEKAIPTFVVAALEDRSLPVYGDGRNRREWLFVTDFAMALLSILDEGDPNGTYNIGGGHDIANIELAREVCRLTGRPESAIELVPDRPGHDLRYALSWDRLSELGWEPEVNFADGLARTVEWYRAHMDWVHSFLQRAGR